MNKVIAEGSRIKNIMGTHVDMFVECRGLIALIYHHAKLYDDCLCSGLDYEAREHSNAVKVLGGIFNATVKENFACNDKLALLGEAQAICLRMMQESKHERIKVISRSLYEIYAGTIRTYVEKFDFLKN